MPVDQENSSYLSIRDLTKKFGQFTALSGVSLDIREGEFVCFLGPSGCGKTTLLRAIAGLDIQTQGQVIQAGLDISALPPTERDFGIVFQSYALFPNLTIASNIAYGLENEGRPKTEIRSRVSELLELVGMPDQAKKYPSQLSGGQQQRVALARAIAISPGLLLLDEPLSALDAKVRVKLRLEIKELQRKLGVTTVMVTHDQEEALTMADRIVVMNGGLIEQVGTPEEIYHTPATRFVADFIGAMNFMPADAARGGEIRIGDSKLHCEYSETLYDQKVVASIRPEDIVLADDEQGDELNVIQAKIEHIEFLGAFGRASMSSEAFGDVGFIADFSASLMRLKKLAPGMNLSVSMPPANIRVYSE